MKPVTRKSQSGEVCDHLGIGSCTCNLVEKRHKRPHKDQWAPDGRFAGGGTHGKQIGRKKKVKIGEGIRTHRAGGVGGVGAYSLNGYTSAPCVRSWRAAGCAWGSRWAGAAGRAGVGVVPIPAPSAGPRPRRAATAQGRLRYGWWVRHHVKPRKRPFHPLHRMTPFNSASIRHQRVTVVWRHGEKTVFYDEQLGATSS